MRTLRGHLADIFQRTQAGYWKFQQEVRGSRGLHQYLRRAIQTLAHLLFFIFGFYFYFWEKIFIYLFISFFLFFIFIFGFYFYFWEKIFIYLFISFFCL